ncbi:MAG: hypothetical protein LAO51_19750, partial [Acidobacteriia bacterium]|nr:hypothetical protein [Terriglobia bacterium]
TQEQPLEVRPDPRAKATETELERQFELGIKVRDRFTDLHRGINRLREVRAQLDALSARLALDPARRPLAERSRAITKSLTAVEEQLVQVKMKSTEGNLRFPSMLNEQLDTLRYVVESADGTPSEPVYKVFDELSSRLDAQLSALATLLDRDLPAFNEEVRAAGVPAVSAP